MGWSFVIICDHLCDHLWQFVMLSCWKHDIFLTSMWISLVPVQNLHCRSSSPIFLLARTKYRMKVLLFILLTLVLIGIATCIGIASAGLQTLEEGQLMSHCASSYLSFAKKPLSNFHLIYSGPFLKHVLCRGFCCRTFFCCTRCFWLIHNPHFESGFELVESLTIIHGLHTVTVIFAFLTFWKHGETHWSS